MPRSVEEILQQAEELAERFDSYDPASGDELDAGAVALLRSAVQGRSHAEKHLIEAICAARASGMSWTAIAALVGTDRQGPPVAPRDP